MHLFTRTLVVSIVLLSLGSLPLCAAQHPSISVQEPKTAVTRTNQVGSRTIRYFTFGITVRNNGTETSDNLTFVLRDPELPSNRTLGNCTLQPGASKTFTVTDYPIATPGAFYFNVSWSPTSVGFNSYNTGKASFIVGGADAKKSTPGFEGILAFIALGAALVLYRKKTT